MASVSDQVLEIIRQLPDSTGKDIVELLPTVPKGSVAAALTNLYKGRKVTRTPTRTENDRPTFKYQLVDDPSKVPTPKVKQYRSRGAPHRVKIEEVNAAIGGRTGPSVVQTDFIASQSKASMRGRIRQLEDEVASLRTWKADALERYPDLAVDQTTLTARKLVAKILRDGGDTQGADNVLHGSRDGSMIMRATVEALNQGS